MVYYGYKQEAGSRKQEAGSRKQEAGSRKHFVCFLNNLIFKKYHFVNLFSLFNQLIQFPKFKVFSYFLQNQTSIKICLIKFFTIFCGLMFVIIKPSIALTAETAKTIIGNKPFIKLNDNDIQDLSYLFSFDIQKSPSEVSSITLSQQDPIYVVGNVKFNQFITKVAADGESKSVSSIPTLSYDDIDGDTPDPVSAVSGNLTITWSYKNFDGSVKTLTSEQLNQNMDSCLNPYTLTIKADTVKAQSLYGDPSIKDYGSLDKTYTIKVDDPKICYIRPNSMGFYGGSRSNQFETCDSTSNCKFVGGYNPSVFVPRQGFIAYGEKKFPTTGFNNAAFTLKMSNSENVYSFTSSNPSLASITNDGVVTLKSTTKPPLPFTVTLSARAKYESIDDEKTINYTFTVNKWARFISRVKYKTTMRLSDPDGTYPAANACAGRDLGAITPEQAASYFYSITDITNAPSSVNAVTGHGTGSLPGWVENQYERLSRDIDGTFSGEWGELFKRTYPDSGLETIAGSCTWASGSWNDEQVFSTDAGTGYVGYNHLRAESCTAVCR